MGVAASRSIFSYNITQVQALFQLSFYWCRVSGKIRKKSFCSMYVRSSNYMMEESKEGMRMWKLP